MQQVIDAALAGRSIPLELLDRHERLGRQLGVTDTAVTNFFRILGERKVAIEDLDAKLREIAARHLTMLKKAEPVPGEDPHVEALKKEAIAAIAAGDYARAEALLEQASDADVVAGRKAQDAAKLAQDAASKAQDIANRRFVAAAKAKADLGQLKLTQLQYEAAAREFQAAANWCLRSSP